MNKYSEKLSNTLIVFLAIIIINYKNGKLNIDRSQWMKIFIHTL